jgi:hypothetical protein
MSDNEQRIREAAYRVWEEEGRPNGQEHRHWASAAHRIDAEDSTPAQPAPESDESAMQTVPASRTVRGKLGSLGSPGANSTRAAPVVAKSSGGDRRPVNDR